MADKVIVAVVGVALCASTLLAWQSAGPQQRRVTSAAAANQQRLMAAAKILADWSQVDNTPVTSRFRNASNVEVDATYTCGQLRMHAPTGQWGLVLPSKPTSGSGCETIYQLGQPVVPGWMLPVEKAGNVQQTNACVATIVQACADVEQKHVGRVLNEYVEMLSAVIDDQALLERALTTR
jgi:hypothetical protein